MTVTDDFRAARDRCLPCAMDYGRRAANFQWPRFEEFNFALDWFDADRGGPGQGRQPGAGDRGAGRLGHAAQLRRAVRRSNQVANWLRGQGVRRGDRMIIMLGNQVELWELMLAGIKLGIVLIPTTTLMGPADLKDRVERGEAGWAAVGSSNIGKFAEVPGDYTLIEIGDGGLPPQRQRQAAAQYAESAAAPADFTPDAPTQADETLLLYFTSGTTSKAKLVEHTHTSYPVGHLSTMYWIGLEPGDVHLNVASPGWAKHAWSNVFTPVDRRGLRVHLQLRALRRQRPDGADGPREGHQFLRPAHGLADAHPGRPRPCSKTRPPRWCPPASRSTPR